MTTPLPDRTTIPLLRRPRERLAAIVGVTPEARVATVRAMSARHGNDRIGYWLQLVLSMGIATYGLVLGSTGVVIGAMLVSPLMGPLVEIGMGLVVGSPMLVLHSTLRTTASVAVVIGCSAGLTLLLPYHETNGEILSRASPTLLDLYVASFCALAAAYTTVRQGSDTVTAAAGTAISIALVPPLCVVGWGLGAGRFSIARGAAMLFTANLCAIVFFTVVVFILLAYDAVDVRSVEDGVGKEPRLLDRAALRLRGLFGSRYGFALRLVMPVALVAAVFFPLRRALSEVAWTAHVRGDVQHILDELPPAKRAVRSSVSVERHEIAIRLVIVGEAASARDLKSEIETKVAAVTGVAPSVEVIAVPDFEAVRIAAEGLTNAPTIPAAPKPDVDLVQHEIDAELRHRWPTGVTGDLASWRLSVGSDGTAEVEVVHFGVPLGDAGERMLGSALSERILHTVVVRDLPLSTVAADAPREGGVEWLSSLTRLVDGALAARLGTICITSVDVDPKAKDAKIIATVNSLLLEQTARLPSARVQVMHGAQWSAKLSPDKCPIVENADTGAAPGDF